MTYNGFEKTHFASVRTDLIRVKNLSVLTCKQSAKYCTLNNFLRGIMKRYKSVATLLLATLLCGCAASQRLSSTDKARSKTVTLSDHVMKDNLSIQAPGWANPGMMFGAIGAGVGAVAAENVKGSTASQAPGAMQADFNAYLIANAISIETIVREEFETVLRESGKVALLPQTAENATLPVITVSVPMYGFGVTHLLGENVVPIFKISAAMTDSTGKVMWTESEMMLPSIMSPMDATPWVTLRADPKVVERDWRKASRYIAQKIIATL